MKRISTLVPFLALIFLGACKEKDPTSTPQARGGSMQLNISETVNGKSLVFNDFQYMTEAGDTFQVTLLQYYLSNFSFHSPETGWKQVSHYQLVRADEASTSTFTIKDLPFGNYDSIRFYMGIDSVTNHDISKEGNLDPGYGMIWTWNSGYIFYMFEGKFVDSLNRVIPFAYHIGGDDYLMTYEMALPTSKTLSSSQTLANIDLTLELDEIFKTPTRIELNHVAKVSHTFDEPALTTQLKDNLLDAYTVK
ncbi:MAG: hypothetical protein GC180_04040 [Bacteroidetes bacterium]|nr:hypothetical protein [Bacteroidota bacterium]